MRLGVIGGLGPMATAYYLELVVRMTDAKRDQDHPEIMVMDIPTIPDRTAFILGKSEEDPVGPMVQLGKQLKVWARRCWLPPVSRPTISMRRCSRGVGFR